jgi:hypothetical protein
MAKKMGYNAGIVGAFWGISASMIADKAEMTGQT